MTIDASVSVKYPSPPWKLQGQLYGSIWAVPARLFRAELPPEFKAVINLGRVGVFAGFVDYQPGSTLSYHELIAGVVIQRRGKLRYWFNVTHMYVDSVPSMQGGREVWGVPKQLANFDYQFARNNRDLKAIARDADGRVLARGNFKSLIKLPSKLVLPVPFPDLQMLHNRPYYSWGTFWSALEICQSGMDIPEDSPLAALGIVGRRPFVHFGGLDFRILLKAAKPVKD
jgi:hypothetical protein